MDTNTIINFVLTLITVATITFSISERKRRNDQVKIWQESANGISKALRLIIAGARTEEYSNNKAISNAIMATEASVFSLYQSLYQERCISEKEYKKRQKEIHEQVLEDRKPDK